MDSHWWLYETASICGGRGRPAINANAQYPFFYIEVFDLGNEEIIDSH